MNRYFLPGLIMVFLLSVSCQSDEDSMKQDLKNLYDNEIWLRGERALTYSPITITDYVCDRSAGSKNDFYSEGDYWWPDPENPDGPYIRRDGESNPDNFVAHRHAMIRMSRIVGELTTAYLLSGNEAYARQVSLHLEAWFVDPATRMHPNLLYAQAIKGRVIGRGIGIIDTIHLIEVAQSVLKLRELSAIDKELLDAVEAWFSDYLEWLTTHPYGIEEREAKNNHGTCWVMQVAAFAQLTNNQDLLTYCRERYKHVLLPEQMAVDGSFPLETVRTKPYGYSLFNLDAMVALCHILSTKEDNLWKYQTETGLSIQSGIDFLVPYIADKSLWPFQKDVMYWDEWPVAHAFLLFSAWQNKDVALYQMWKSLERHPHSDEIVRNMPIKNPIIWLK
jgi:hypothetical protein